MEMRHLKKLDEEKINQAQALTLERELRGNEIYFFSFQFLCLLLRFYGIIFPGLDYWVYGLPFSIFILYNLIFVDFGYYAFLHIFYPEQDHMLR